MNKIDINFLKKTLCIQSCSYEQWRMFAFIVRNAASIPGAALYVDNGNIYITKGKAEVYPCMVAHMDTVHVIVESLVTIEINGNITGFNLDTMTQVGIGGDDKVGVFIALSALKKFDNIKIAFFRDEEVGCVGSYTADLEFFRDCSFVLQCDRRGNSDFVYCASDVELCSEKFLADVNPLLKKYGYRKSVGMITDVMALKELGLDISCANISCGYYNPHCKNEYVNINDVETCLNLVYEIIKNCGNTVYKHKFLGRYMGYTPYYPSYKDRYRQNYDYDYCVTCGTPENKKLMSDYNECSYCANSRKEKPVDKCFSCDELNVLSYDVHFGVFLCDSCKNGISL